MNISIGIATGALGLSLLTGCGGRTQERDWREDLTETDLVNAQESVALASTVYETHIASLTPACAEAIQPFLFGGNRSNTPTNLANFAVKSACAESPLALPQARANFNETMQALDFLATVEEAVANS